MQVPNERTVGFLSVVLEEKRGTASVEGRASTIHNGGNRSRAGRNLPDGAPATAAVDSVGPGVSWIVGQKVAFKSAVATRYCWPHGGGSPESGSRALRLSNRCASIVVTKDSPLSLNKKKIKQRKKEKVRCPNPMSGAPFIERRGMRALKVSSFGSSPVLTYITTAGRFPKPYFLA